MEIRYYNRQTQRVETEQVYGDRAVRWLYDTRWGQWLGQWLAGNGILSDCYGIMQDSACGRSKIAPFVEKFGVDLEEFEPGEGGNLEFPYRSFNDFFIRQFKPGRRWFVEERNLFPAFCEGRYYGYERVTAETTIPVKGGI